MGLFNKWKRHATAGGDIGTKYAISKISKTAIVFAAALISCVASTSIYSHADGGGGSGGSGGNAGANGVAHHVIWSDGGTIDSNGNFTPTGATGSASVTEWLKKWQTTEGYEFNGTETDSAGHNHRQVFYDAANTAINNAVKRTGQDAQHIRIVGMGWWSCGLNPRGRGFLAGKTKEQCLDRQATADELPNATTDGTPFWDDDMRATIYQKALNDSTSPCSIVIAAVADTEYPATVPVSFQKQGDPNTISSENQWGDKGVKVPASQMKDKYSYEGAVYGVYKDESCTQLVEDLTIGADGMTTAQMLRGTTYFLKEKTAPKGWALSGDVQKVDTGGGTTVTLNEQPNYGELTIKKVDGTNKQALIPQEGFIFTITNDATQESWTQTSDISGKVTFSHLAFGDYTVVENSAPSPYLVDSTEHKITINEDNIDKTQIGVQVKKENLDITDELPSTPPTKLTKTDTADGSVLEGATYELYAVSDVVVPSGKLYDAGKTIASYTTDSKGEFTIPSGVMYPDKNGDFNYALREVAAPEGHLINTGKVIKLTGKYVDDKTSTISVATNNQVTDTDQANEFDLTKTVLKKDGDTNDDKTVEGATFRIWNKSDELTLSPNSGRVSYALRVDKGDTSHKIVIYQQIDYAEAVLSSVSGNETDYEIVLSDENGNTYELKKGSKSATRLAAGTYTVKLKTTDDKKDVDSFTGDTKITVKNGDRVEYSVSVGATSGKPSVSVKTSEIADRQASVYTTNGAYVSNNLKTDAIYHVQLDGKTIYTLYTDADHDVKAGSKIYGRYDTKATEYAYKRQPMLLTSDSKFIDKFTISGKDYPVQTKVGKDGKITIKRLHSGSYGFGEIDVPINKDKTKTYLINTTVYYFDVAEKTGLINGKAVYGVDSKNDETRLNISKREVTGGAEIPGAKFELKDANKNLMDSWTSTDKPHYIEQLAPGEYTLIERVTPSNYDQSVRIKFTLDDTGKVQSQEMLDKPIKIATSIDKRQEIATPTAEYVQANGDGANKADPVKKQNGMFAYSIDYRNKSNTWVDEFTVYDSLDGVNAGLVKLNSLKTAQGYKDYNGKLNVWYQTNKTPADYADDKDKANATLDDGHINAWITGDTRSDNSKKNDPDGDGRTLDYTGWKLWKKDVSALSGETLDVSQLGLADDEYVTAIRLEYGRVEKGFTTCTSAWDRDNLKDEHDDENNIDYLHKEGFAPDKTVEAVKANLSTLVSFVSTKTKSDKADKVLTDDDQKTIDDIMDRIEEGSNASSDEEIAEAIDDAKAFAEAKLDAMFADSALATSKGLNQLIATLTDSLNQVRNAVPSDIAAKGDKALKAAADAVDSGDPEKLAKAKEDLKSACASVIDSLTSRAASSTDINYAPLVLNMQVTNNYRNKAALTNTASVVAYRNGGGADLELEGNDSDKVTQMPSADDDLANDLLAQTGVEAAGIAGAAIAAFGIAIVAKKRMTK